MKSEKYSTIKKIIFDAEHGSIKSAYRLHKLYKEGVSVENDIEKSTYWYKKATSNLNHIDIKIKKITALSFRGFEKVDIDFEPDTTLLVGINGSGKSNILDLCFIGLSWISSGITSSTGHGSKLIHSDVNRKASTDICSINIEFNLNDKETFSLILEKQPEGSKIKPKSDYTQVKLLTSMYLDLTNDIELPRPIFVYYNIDRANRTHSKNTRDKNTLKDNSKGLYASRDFSDFLIWLKEIIYTKEKNKVNTSEIDKIEKLKIEFESINNMYNIIAENSDPQVKQQIENLINDKKLKIKELESKTNEIDNKNILKKILAEVNKFIPQISDITLLESQNGSSEIFINKSNSHIELTQLSKGEITLFCLIGDIFRRIYILNGENFDFGKIYGVILIDEIDLHLHPLWQQKIIPTLSSTFKNIQFIFSTHSPQVVSTALNQSIRLLEAERVLPLSIGTNGADSSRILKTIFKADPRGKDDIKISQYFYEFLELVYNKGDFSSPEYEKLHRLLSEAFKNNDPEFIQACLYAESLKWEAEHETP